MFLPNKRNDSLKDTIITLFLLGCNCIKKKYLVFTIVPICAIILLEVMRMAINKSYNHVTGITYFYETTVVTDPETGEKHRKRRVVGKLDEKTGKMVPTDGKGKRFSSSEDSSGAQSVADMYKASYEKAKHESKMASSELAATRDALRKAVAVLQHLDNQVIALHSEMDQTVAILKKGLSQEAHDSV